MDRRKRTILEKFNEKNEVLYYEEAIRKGLNKTEEELYNEYIYGANTILDIGCAAGRVTSDLAKRGHDLTGIDFSAKMIEAAIRNAKKYGCKPKFILADIEDYHLERNYDCILMFSQFVEHIPDRKNRVRLLAKLKDSLNIDGKIIFTTHERNIDFSYKMIWMIKSLIKQSEPGDTWISKSNPNLLDTRKMFFHLYTKDEAISDIINAGLRLDDTVEIPLINRPLRKCFQYAFVCSNPKNN